MAGDPLAPASTRVLVLVLVLAGRTSPWLAAALLCSPSSALAQPQPVTFAVDLASQRYWPATPRVVLDADDDDDDGVIDLAQDSDVPLEDLARLHLTERSSDAGVTLRLRGGLRWVKAGRPLATPETRVEPGDTWPEIQGVRASVAPGDASVEVEVDGRPAQVVPVTVVALFFLGARNQPLDPATDALFLSRHVTHDRTLPRDAASSAESPDWANYRGALHDPSLHARAHHPTLSVTALAPHEDRVVSRLRHVPTTRSASQRALRTPFLRLVGDRTDMGAPEVGDRLLAVRLRDRVRLQYRAGRAELSQDIRVGRPGREGGPGAALRGTLRLRAVRITPGGRPAVGRDDLDALGLLREQVEVANEIWLQCGVDFGRPDRADAAVVDPPPPALLSIADGDGLPARGGGWIRFRAGQKRVAVRTRSGASPSETALQVAHALEAQDLLARVTVNSRTEFGAGRSADVVVRTPRGALVSLTPLPQRPLSTDASQTAAIGVVELSDGLSQFDNMSASAGTLEERTLVKLLSDDDPTTIDVFVISRFENPERQGEAFIEGDGGAIVNTLILDRNGVRFQRQAWVQSHELGHVLLDAPYHPDSIGPDRPWLLMDADARQGRVTGPKRLTPEECERVRSRSGPSAAPPLLHPHPD